MDEKTHVFIFLKHLTLPEFLNKVFLYESAYFKITLFNPILTTVLYLS
jgi:hypothetical protein